MLRIFIPSIILFCFFYFALRSLKTSWEQRKLPHWSKVFLGLLAWGALLSFFGILWGVAQPIIQLFTSPTMGLAFELVGLALGAAVIAKYANANPEFFDFPSMKPFLKDSLAFVNPALRWDNVFEDLDKHEVRRIYKEVSGRELQEGDEQLKRQVDAALPTAFSRDTRVPAPKGVDALLAQLITSPHLQSELGQLRAGKVADISDSWKINRLKKSSHAYFSLVEKVAVDPAASILDLQLQSELFTEERVKDPVLLYRLKQDVYDFLQAVHQQDWVQPYVGGIKTFRCTCSHYEDEAFIGPRTHRVCSFEMPRAELKAREQSYYNAGEMKTEILIQ